MAQNYTKVGWKDHILDGTKVLQQGTPVSASNLNKMDAGIELAHQKLEGSNRQTQAISHGLQVLNGDVNAPISLQMEGRTLTPLQNSVLEAGKYYLQADKKTWFAVNGTGFKGIQKFTGLSGNVNLTRIVNFESKIPGSTLENPHIAKRTAGGQSGSTTLQTPSSIPNEFAVADLNGITKLDGTGILLSANNNGAITQMVFSFNIIEEIERNIGRIPGNTLAQKVVWAKDNINKFTWYWHGYGSGPAGNKATVNLWYADSAKWAEDAWGQKKTNTSSAISAVTNFQLASEVPKIIDSNGFYHLVAYADASDGVTSSVLVTDYVELQIELKTTATLHAPRVPLYEVTKEHYDAALVTWNEDEVMRRYPMVEGVQHIQNPFIIAEGENLLPPFSDWIIATGVNLLSAYEVGYSASTSLSTMIFVNVLPNTTYTISLEGNGRLYFVERDAANNADITSTGKSIEPKAGARVSLTFTTTANAKILRLSATNIGSGDFNHKNPMLTLGNVDKPFVPRNPSNLFVETKLGAIGTAKDLLFDQDGKLMVRKTIEKDIALDGSKAWLYHSSQNGNVTAKIFTLAVNLPVSRSSVLTKYNGKLMTINSVVNDADTYNGLNATGDIYLTTSYDDMGLTLTTYAPTNDEVKAYFNGWKAKTVDTNGKPTAWKSIADGTDAPTQTVAYVSANKATGYTPYMLSYVLATPIILEVKYEGAISVNGLTQVEVGSGVIIREKVVPYKSSTTYEINFTTVQKLANKAEKILAVYRNGKIDNVWSFRTDVNAYGKMRAVAFTPETVDPTAEYTVSYAVFDRQQYTANALVASATYANSIRTALDDNIKATEDNKREISINALQIYNMMVRMKAGGI